MYFCKNCGAEFDEPLHGTCPACGAARRQLERYEEEVPSDSGAPIYGPPPGDAGYRRDEPAESAPYTSGRKPSGGGSAGVYGPPKHSGPSASSRGLRSRSTGCGPLIIGLILLVVIGGGVAAVFYFVDDCDMSNGDYTYTESVDTSEPLFRNRAAEMEDAGYEPVPDMAPDLWPVADHTLWFIDGATGELWYNTLNVPSANKVPLSPAPDYLGDIHPLPDGSGVLAVMDYNGEYGVYAVSPAGQTALLTSAAELAELLLGLKYMPEEFYAGVRTALESRELLGEPRMKADGSLMAVGAGPVGDTRVLVIPAGGQSYVLDRYIKNAVPCSFVGSQLFIEYNPGGTPMVKRYDLESDTDEFVSLTFYDGGFVSDGIRMAYLSNDGGRPVIRYGALETPYDAELLVLPGGQGETVSLAAGQIVCAVAPTEGQDGFYFRHFDNPEPEDLYPITFTKTLDLESAYFGPPLSQPVEEEPSPPLSS